MLEGLQEALASVRKAREAAMLKAKETLAPALQQFLKDNPECKSIAWTQYTPYFCDGDPCVFGVNDPIFLRTKVDEYDYDLEGSGEEIRLYGEGSRSELAKNCKQVKDALMEADEVLEEVFGDHVQVVVNEDGVHVQEWSHD